MPEGHTVHRLARALGDLFLGEPLRVSSPQGRFADGAALLDGRTLVAAEAWGKHLFLGFDGLPAVEGASAPDLWLRVHLGLYGAWTFSGDGSAVVVHAIGAPRRRVGERETVPAGPAAPPEPAAGATDGWVPPAPRGAVRARLRGVHAVADLTGPTACEVVTPEEKRAVEARLGPDPLRPDADADAFVAAVGRSRTAVGRLLMDQAVVAGVGNIYRAEALFRAGLDPHRPGRDVPAGTVRALWDDLVVLLAAGVRDGAIVTTRPEHRGTPGVLGDPDGPGRRGRVRQNTDGTPGAVPAADAFYVYHRDGLPCRVCGTTVVVEEVAGRSLYRCPTCQR